MEFEPQERRKNPSFLSPTAADLDEIFRLLRSQPLKTSYSLRLNNLKIPVEASFVDTAQLLTQFGVPEQEITQRTWSTVQTTDTFGFLAFLLLNARSDKATIVQFSGDKNSTPWKNFPQVGKKQIYTQNGLKIVVRLLHSNTGDFLVKNELFIKWQDMDEHILVEHLMYHKWALDDIPKGFSELFEFMENIEMSSYGQKKFIICSNGGQGPSYIAIASLIPHLSVLACYRSQAVHNGYNFWINPSEGVKDIVGAMISSVQEQTGLFLKDSQQRYIYRALSLYWRYKNKFPEFLLPLAVNLSHILQIHKVREEKRRNGNYARYFTFHAKSSPELNPHVSILPYDSTRLLFDETHLKNKYINASCIDPVNLLRFGIAGYSRKWIAASAPRAGNKMDTMSAFLAMFLAPHQSRVTSSSPPIKTVIQLTTVSKGKRECLPYFPENLHQPQPFGDVIVTTTSHSSIKDADGLCSIFKVGYKKNSKCVTHFHYQKWPDKDVPEDLDSFLNFVVHVLKITSPQEKILVHCSAGVGRTGCFLVIATILPHLHELATNKSLDKFSTISKDLELMSGLPPYFYPIDLQQKVQDVVGAVLDHFLEYRMKMALAQDQKIFCYVALRRAWVRNLYTKLER